MTLLECRGVNKRFGGLQALSEVSLQVRPDAMTGIIGPNGAGKTTLFNVIAGAEPVTSGKIVFKGRDVTGRDPGWICRQGIARTCQMPRPFKALSVRDNVLVGQLFGRNGTRPREGLPRTAEECLARVGLERDGNRIAGTLTFVDQKRLELARALATGPELLLLDEPFSGLNPTEVRDFLTIVRDLHAAGITVLIIEHILSVIMSLCTHAVLLDHGRAVLEGPPAQVSKDPVFMNVYLGADHV
jgi:branched-chain amino acid transport system ATP-binding protein